MNAAPTISPLAWALILCLSALWGGSYFFAGIAVAELPPLTIVTLRVGIAALLLLFLRPLLGVALPTGRTVWLAFFAMGLLNNAIPFSLIVWGQTQIASGLAAIMNATTPLFAVLVAHALTDNEKLTPAKALGLAIGFAGVVVLIGAGAFTGVGFASAPALVACAGAALSYAFAGVFGRRFARRGLAPMQIATGQLVCSSLVLLPIALAAEAPWSLSIPSAKTVAAIVGLAAFSTAFAYILYFRILALAGAVNLLLVTFLIPPFAIFLGVVVLGERLAVSDVVGLALILTGLACIDGRYIFRHQSSESVRR